jgi:PAS domain S-box-containing protein/putative nucleotidyltransferase with HDIG domain
MKGDYHNAKRILIVEDVIVVSMEIKDKLERMGYEVVATAVSGEEAIEKAHQLEPDLILMDIMLDGDLNGIEAAQEIRDTLSIPVIYTTALSGEEVIERAQITDPYGYLIKPIEEKELLISIEIALRRHDFEKKLEESEKRFRTLFEESKDAVYIRDSEGNYIDLNRSMLQLFGYEREDLEHFNVNDLFDDPEDMRAFEKALQENGFVKDFEVKMRRKDGSGLICVTTANALRENGTTTGYQGIIRDITDKKRSEEEIRRGYERLRKTIDGIVQAMSLTVETRDPYTAGHQKRVAGLAVAIAEEMGLDSNQIAGIRMAGEIHDIGKIYVPSEILSKPGKITDAEFSIIKTHPLVGYEILKSIEFPWPIAQIVYQHHERMDGSGYPQGLSGDDLLIEARIMTVADVVEAMASDRPYRPALGIDVALDEIQKNSGLYYDPDAVDACNRLFTEKGYCIEEATKTMLF